MVGKFGITSAYSMVYVYTAELYPLWSETWVWGSAPQHPALAASCLPTLFTLVSTMEHWSDGWDKSSKYLICELDTSTYIISRMHPYWDPGWRRCFPSVVGRRHPFQMEDSS